MRALSRAWDFRAPNVGTAGTAAVRGELPGGVWEDRRVRRDTVPYLAGEEHRARYAVVAKIVAYGGVGEAWGELFAELARGEVVGNVRKAQGTGGKAGRVFFRAWHQMYYEGFMTPVQHGYVAKLNSSATRCNIGMLQRPLYYAGCNIGMLQVDKMQHANVASCTPRCNIGMLQSCLGGSNVSKLAKIPCSDSFATLQRCKVAKLSPIHIRECCAQDATLACCKLTRCNIGMLHLLETYKMQHWHVAKLNPLQMQHANVASCLAHLTGVPRG